MLTCSHFVDLCCSSSVLCSLPLLQNSAGTLHLHVPGCPSHCNSFAQGHCVALAAGVEFEFEWPHCHQDVLTRTGGKFVTCEGTPLLPSAIEVLPGLCHYYGQWLILKCHVKLNRSLTIISRKQNSILGVHSHSPNWFHSNSTWELFTKSSKPLSSTDTQTAVESVIFWYPCAQCLSVSSCDNKGYFSTATLALAHDWFVILDARVPCSCSLRLGEDASIFLQNRNTAILGVFMSALWKLPFTPILVSRMVPVSAMLFLLTNGSSNMLCIQIQKWAEGECA